TIAGMNPTTSTAISPRRNEFGTSIAWKISAAACNTSQLTATYAIATRMTLRRLSSARKEVRSVIDSPSRFRRVLRRPDAVVDAPRNLPVEFDPRELLRRHADLAQERQPARVVVQTVQESIFENRRNTSIPFDFLFEPFESRVGFAPKRMNLREPKRP